MIKKIINLSHWSKFYFILVALFAQSVCATDQTNQKLDTWISRAKENIHHAKLSNGLTVIYYHLPTTYEVFVGVSYAIGSKNEDAGQHGFAHMVEHMIFKGTSTMSETDLHRITEKFSVNRYNANTWLEQTNYYFVSDNKNWHVFVDIMADCMENVRFDENIFASEVKAVINELKMRNANPFIKMIDLFYNECYPLNHPYGHAVGGDKEILLHATAGDLKNFYQNYYGPEDATLFIVGNLEKNQVFNQAQKSFGHIKPAPKKHKNKPPYNQNFFKLDFKKKNIDCYTHTPNPSVDYIWHIPGLKNQPNSSASCIAYVLQERLRSLKDDLGLALATNAYAYHELLAGIFVISLEPKLDHEKKHEHKIVKKSLAFIETTLHDIMQHGPTDEELKIFKSSCRNSFLTSFENCSDIAQLLQSTYYIHQNPYQTFDDLNHTESLTKEIVAHYCKQYLRPILMNTIICHPIPDNEKEVWLETQNKLDHYEQTILEEKIRESALETTSLMHNLPEAESLSFAFEKPDDSFVLSNGLTVYIKHRDTTPFITGECLFKNEEMFDLFCKINHEASTRHLAMHLLPEASTAWEQLGLPKQSKQDIRNFFHNLGASCNYHEDGGSFSCLNTDFINVAQHFIQILTHPEYPEKSFITAQENALKRIEFSQENPQYLAKRKLSHYLYQNYPWQVTDQEIIQEIHQCTKKDLESFHQRYIAPSNMFLVIVGNIDAETLKQELEQSFGAWKHPERAERMLVNLDKLSVDIPEISNPTAQEFQAFLPQEQVMLMCGRLTTYQDTNDRMALRLLEHYIHRRLFEIREKTGLFYTCHSNLSASAHKTMGMATINFLVSVDLVAQAELAIKEVLQNISDMGIDEQDLKIAQQNYLSILATGFSTNGSLAHSYGELIANNQDWDYFDKKLEKCDRLTLQEINNYAQKYLNPGEWTFVKIGRLS